MILQMIITPIVCYPATRYHGHHDDAASAAVATPQPEIQLLADRTATYEELARALSIAHAAGLARIGFVMQPEH